MATHSSTLAWKIPWMEEPGGLQSMGPESDTTEQLHFLFLLYNREIEDFKKQTQHQRKEKEHCEENKRMVVDHLGQNIPVPTETVNHKRKVIKLVFYIKHRVMTL